MAQTKSKRGERQSNRGERQAKRGERQAKRAKLLEPARAREGHRWIRLTVLGAVVQAWMFVAVVALCIPHLLTLLLALGVAYSVAAPLLLHYLDSDIDRRVSSESATVVLAGQFQRE